MAVFISDWALLAGLEGVELPHLITLVNELLCDLKPITRHIREHIKKKKDNQLRDMRALGFSHINI